MYTVRCCHAIHLRQSHCPRQLFYSPAPTEDSPTCSPNTLSYLLSSTATADAPGPFNALHPPSSLLMYVAESQRSWLPMLARKTSGVKWWLLYYFCVLLLWWRQQFAPAVRFAFHCPRFAKREWVRLKEWVRCVHLSGKDCRGSLRCWIKRLYERGESEWIKSTAARQAKWD